MAERNLPHQADLAQGGWRPIAEAPHDGTPIQARARDELGEWTLWFPVCWKHHSAGPGWSNARAPGVPRIYLELIAWRPWENSVGNLWAMRP